MNLKVEENDMLKKWMIGLGIGLCLASPMGTAADAAGAQQIQQLNSQIQAQLQQIQEAQQKQMKELNTKIQTQLKQIKTDLDASIAKVNTQNQTQLKQVQEALQAQIKQIQAETAKNHP